MGLFAFLNKEKPITDLEIRFYAEAKELFDEGVLTEIFKYNYISFCNVGNAYYVAFLLFDHGTENLEFMILLDEELDFVFNGFECFYEMFKARPADKKCVYIFNDRAKSTMRNSYERVKKEGVKIDLEYEAKLLKKHRRRNELIKR